MSVGQPSVSVANENEGDSRRGLARTHEHSLAHWISGNGREQNVSSGERVASLAAGAALAMLGLGRRDLTGLVIAGVGGALAYRGTSGHCAMYQALNIDRTNGHQATEHRRLAETGVQVSSSYLINKTPEMLYTFWRNFENLPQFMDHLESVQVLDNGCSHWVAKAPRVYGGSVEWDAEVIAEEPGAYIAWRSVPGSEIVNEGSIRFTKALGDRGTYVSVVLKYEPPFGQVGRWIANLFGEEPHQQIQSDLRRFKRLMELGEQPTIEGQPRGGCLKSSSNR